MSQNISPQELSRTKGVADALAPIWKDLIETPLDRIGLLTSPMKRFGVFSVGTGILLLAVKPISLFDENGKPRPWSTTTDSHASVAINWIAFSGLIGVMSVLFI